MTEPEFILNDSANLTTTWELLVNEWWPGEPILTPVYRIPERDATNTGKLSLKEGDWISFSRIVARVGYEVGVHSVTKAEWFEMGAKLIAARSGESIDAVKKVITELGLSSPFKGIKASIYDELIRPLIQQTKPENRNQRAMWFYDYAEPHMGQISGQTVKLTGQRDPGRRSGDYGEDWEPPVLCATRRQVLYKVEANLPDMFSRSTVMIYPADAKVKQ